MFLKNRRGMETLQMIIMGLLVIALGVLFIGRFVGGVGDTGDVTNSVLDDTGGSLTNLTNTLTN